MPDVRTMTLSGTAKIDRSSPLPLYFQLARLLTEDIVRGRFSPGDRLTSEPDIGDQFGVSRATVRQALQRLESDGLIQRIKGRGTFVSGSREHSWLLQSSGGFFHEEVERLGFDVTSEILRAEVAPLTHWASDALGLVEGTRGVILERLRFIDGKGALYVADYLPVRFADAALSLADEDGSLYDRLEARAGVTVHGGRRTLEAVHAEARVTQILGIKPRAPLLFIESVAWDAERQPFHAFQSWLRTDRIRVEVEVTRKQGVDLPANPPVESEPATNPKRDGRSPARRRTHGLSTSGSR
jgi:GntR family transcriptional regulator